MIFFKSILRLQVEKTCAQLNSLQICSNLWSYIWSLISFNGRWASNLCICCKTLQKTIRFIGLNSALQGSQFQNRGSHSCGINRLFWKLYSKDGQMEMGFNSQIHSVVKLYILTTLSPSAMTIAVRCNVVFLMLVTGQTSTAVSFFYQCCLHKVYLI